MKTFISLKSLDTLGFWASAGCALHCLSLPLVVSLSAFSSLTFLHQPYIEESIIALSVVLGLSSMLPSYFRYHRSFSALYLLAIGFSIIGLSRIPSIGVWEIVLTSSGATLVAVSHVRNHRLCKQTDYSVSK